MFRDVPGCSGMFRNVLEFSMFRDVPCSGFYRRPWRKRYLRIVSLRNRMANRTERQNAWSDKRDTAITCVFCRDIHLY